MKSSNGKIAKSPYCRGVDRVGKGTGRLDGWKGWEGGPKGPV
uniref:Uncharacterized protein n=1 Tax=Octopus bimaculoides TaxID=37653 RepID=A0A0L8FQ32_OCTBM